MHSAAATAPRSTHPSETGSRTSAATLALLQSPLFVDHQAMDTLRAAVASGNLSPDQEMSARRKIAGMEARMGKIAEKVGEITGGRDLGELIDEKLGRGGHGTFSKGDGTWARKLLEGGELPGHVQIDLAIRGAGTDVDAVQKALEGKHPHEIAKIANDFKDTFGKESFSLLGGATGLLRPGSSKKADNLDAFSFLQAALEGDLSGGDLHAVKKLLVGDPKQVYNPETGEGDPQRRLEMELDLKTQDDAFARKGNVLGSSDILRAVFERKQGGLQSDDVLELAKRDLDEFLVNHSLALRDKSQPGHAEAWAKYEELRAFHALVGDESNTARDEIAKSAGDKAALFAKIAMTGGGAVAAGQLFAVSNGFTGLWGQSDVVAAGLKILVEGTARGKAMTSEEASKLVATLGVEVFKGDGKALAALLKAIPSEGAAPWLLKNPQLLTSLMKGGLEVDVREGQVLKQALSAFALDFGKEAIKGGSAVIGKDWGHGLTNGLQGIGEVKNLESGEVEMTVGAQYSADHGVGVADPVKDKLTEGHDGGIEVQSAAINKGLSELGEQGREESLAAFEASSKAKGPKGGAGGGAVSGATTSLRPADTLRSSSDSMGIEPASDGLINNISARRNVTIVQEGTEEMRYLDYVGAEANV